MLSFVNIVVLTAQSESDDQRSQTRVCFLAEMGNSSTYLFDSNGEMTTRQNNPLPPLSMTKKQRDLLNVLIAEQAYLVRSHRRRAYLLVRKPRAGQRKEVTLAVFNALRPYLDSRSVRRGEQLPDGDGWNNRPATIWKAAG